VCSFLSHVRGMYPDAICARCEDKGCRLGLQGLEPHVILKGEACVPGGGDKPKMCDNIVFCQPGDLLIGVVELKTKNLKACAVREQLGNGTRLVKSILDGWPDKPPKYDFYAVVLAQAWKSPIPRRVLTREPLALEGRKHPVLLGDCGDEFSDIITKASRGGRRR